MNSHDLPFSVHRKQMSMRDGASLTIIKLEVLTDERQWEAGPYASILGHWYDLEALATFQHRLGVFRHPGTSKDSQPQPVPDYIVQSVELRSGFPLCTEEDFCMFCQHTVRKRLFSFFGADHVAC